MSNHEVRLRELLAYYGSDITQWPEEAHAFAREAQHTLLLAKLMEDEKRFEKLLHLRLPPEAASVTLSERIIELSLTRRQTLPFAGWMRDVFAEVRPTALAAMLVLGFAIGFGIITITPHDRSTAFVQSTFDDEGAIL